MANKRPQIKNPKKMIAYARKLSNGDYSDIGQEKSFIKERLASFNKIVRVLVQQSNRGKYSAWWDNKKKAFTVVYRNRVIFNLHANISEEIRNGEGQILRVCVKELGWWSAMKFTIGLS